MIEGFDVEGVIMSKLRFCVFFFFLEREEVD